jgi:hypothetical protein
VRRAGRLRLCCAVLAERVRTFFRWLPTERVFCSPTLSHAASPQTHSASAAPQRLPGFGHSRDHPKAAFTFAGLDLDVIYCQRLQAPLAARFFQAAVAPRRDHMVDDIPQFSQGLQPLLLNLLETPRERQAHIAQPGPTMEKFRRSAFSPAMCSATSPYTYFDQ